jgi:transketolase
MLAVADDAANILKEFNIFPTVVSLHTIKPLDIDIILDQSQKSTVIFTLEEHSLIGGLGSAVGEVLLENGYKGVFRKIGLPDQYGQVIGKADHLRQTYGLTPEDISRQIRDAIRQ